MDGTLPSLVRGYIRAPLVGVVEMQMRLPLLRMFPLDYCMSRKVWELG